jgi:hypothetical protein
MVGGIAEKVNILNSDSSKDFAGKPYRGQRFSTVDLLVLTSLDQLLFMLEILFAFVTKQAILIRRSTVLSLLVQLVFPGFCHKWQHEPKLFF